MFPRILYASVLWPLSAGVLLLALALACCGLAWLVGTVLL